jgi:hypothetical protein
MYYTPEIEEFHVGFEYEWFDGSSWNKVTQEIFDGGLFDNGDGEHPFEYQLSDVGIRVKYLDKEDIESLGFTVKQKPLESWYEGECSILDSKEYKIFDYYSKDKKQNIDFNGVIFTIKNKSEFKKLLKQLDIKYNDNQRD